MAKIKTERSPLTKREKHYIIGAHFFSGPISRTLLEDGFPHIIKPRTRKKRIQAAIERGFVVGAVINSGPLMAIKIKSKYGSYGVDVDSPLQYPSTTDNFKYYPDSDLLCWGNNYVNVYCKGVWATVVSSPGLKNKDDATR